jgi:predicted DNA-binding ribbon-helix-helix protein
MSSDTRFRVFRRGNERRAFRLEKSFWEILEKSAKSNGRSLRDVVFEITDAALPDDNMTSRLRTTAIGWLAGRLQKIEKEGEKQSAMMPFYASPAPGIIVSENRRIIAHNKAMLDYISREKGGAATESISDVRFHFEIPMPQILTILSESQGRFLECGFRLTIAGAVSSGRARIWPSWDKLASERQVGAFIIA